MRTRLLSTLMTVGIVTTAVPAIAHHSFSAEYDVDAPVALRGTITKMEWINPHTWFHLEVKRPDGTVENWVIEGGPPSGLIRRGFTKRSVPPGIEVEIKGYRAKDGSLHANAQYITLPDGRALFAGSGAPETPPQEQK